MKLYIIKYIKTRQNSQMNNFRNKNYNKYSRLKKII